MGLDLELMALEKMPHQMIKTLRTTPVFFALVGWQIEWNHGGVKMQTQCQSPRVVLDELGRARRTHQEGVGFESLIGLKDSVDKELRRVTPKISCLKGGVGHGRASG